jgi:hypothetical protein
MYFICYVYVFLLLYMQYSVCCSVYCFCLNVLCTTATSCKPNCSKQRYNIIKLLFNNFIFKVCRRSHWAKTYSQNKVHHIHECLTVITSFTIPSYLFSFPYICLQLGHFRFKYTLHIIHGTTAPFIVPFGQNLCSLCISFRALCYNNNNNNNNNNVTVVPTAR